MAREYKWTKILSVKASPWTAVSVCLLTLTLTAFAAPAPQVPEPATTLPASRPETRPTILIERGPAAQAPSKSDILARLRALQSRQLQEIATLEDAIRKSVKESTTLTLKEELELANKKITRLGEQLSETDRKRNELLARREFVDQLILLIDSKWSGQKLQTFLEHSLLDMAVQDLTNPQGSGDTWRFIVFLSIAIREVPEQREDVFGIIESFMNFASILDPRTPAEFMSNRHYTNSADSVSARPFSREELGDYLDKRNRDLGRSAPRPGTIVAPLPTRPQEPKSDIEIRTRAPIPAEPQRGGDLENAPLDPKTQETQAEPMYISPRFKAVN